ncbi:MAG TPA: Rid family detoxifying hydrolase [Oligoflexia bacterium]|nr:Rid family detoxifying hydrolase [Oligoflexia bacterium]HMP27514.1 Rid family detoxifying hydrolase [Oligoflexia bacterium]
MSENQQTIERINVGPKAIGPYSPAIKAGGFIFISGQIPINPESGKIDSPSIEWQTSQVLNNLRTILSECGSNFNRVVSATIYLQDLADFAVINSIYEKALGDARPTRATIQVAALPLGAKIEISMIALS